METQQKTAELDTERRVEITLAVGRYLQSADRFNDASKAFTKACKLIRRQIGIDQRFVVQVDWKHYLVTSDHDGNFDVEPIASL